MCIKRYFLLFSIILFLSSCGGKETKIETIEEQDIDLQMIAAYEKGAPWSGRPTVTDEGKKRLFGQTAGGNKQDGADS